MTTLSKIVEVERRFGRSARVDADLQGSPPLVGYVLQPSVRKALRTVASNLADSGMASFTWTGPYGGGKSSAALLVASLVAGSPAQRKVAKEIAGEDLAALYDTAFPRRRGVWSVLALTGRRVELRNELANAAGALFGWSSTDIERAIADDRLLLDQLEAEAKARGGVLLLLDELGKFLEFAVNDGGDVHLLQDLAERAARSDGRLVVIGILHQSFEQYSDRLSKSARDEWRKVQGRFLDLPFIAGPDEVVALLAKAVACESRPASAAELARKTAEAVAARRPVEVETLATVLEESWPLHPVTSLLLGPVSRQRFAQNERSVFGFLTSAEPHGFQAHLNATDAASPNPWFGPDELWDYLVANFGMSLAAGADGARLSLALEAIERAAIRSPLHARLAKAAAMIEFFRNGSGLAVSDDILPLCTPDVPAKQVAAALADLVERAVLIRQPRLGGYAIFAGSDFDLEEAIGRHREKLDAAMLLDLPSRLAIGPIAAKRHYFETGALRTFEVLLQFAEHCDGDVAAWAKGCAESLSKVRRRGSGVIVLVVPDGRTFDVPADKAARALAHALEAKGVVAAVGCTKKSLLMLREHVQDLHALDKIETTHPQLEGDRIARRELVGRRNQASDAVRFEVMEALGLAKWHCLDKRADTLDNQPLSAIASAVAHAAYFSTPIVHSELLYRDKPSTSAVAGMRALAYAMVSRASTEELGFTGYPAERGLYLTVLKPFGLHRLDDAGVWRFQDPDDSVAGQSLAAMWAKLAGGRTWRLDELYAVWAAPPFGVKRGVMPIFTLAFILAHRSMIAIYLDGDYQTLVDDVFVDRLLQNPEAVELKRISRSRRDAAFVDRLARLLSTSDDVIEPQPLPVASRLFQSLRALPPWTQRTTTLSDATRRVRDVVLRAKDPEVLLFQDLPAALSADVDPAVAVADALVDASDAYERMLLDLRATLADQLGVDAETFAGIGPRATAVAGVTADLRFDAFAMRTGAFETGDGDIEGLASLLIHKPPRSWSDREHEQAVFEMAKLTRRFWEAEAFAGIKGRRPTAQAISVAVGLRSQETPLFRTFEVTEQEMAVANRLADVLLASLRVTTQRPTVELAALVRVVERLTNGVGDQV